MRNADCRLCPLSDFSSSVCIHGEPVKSDVMIIGEAPTVGDAHQGRLLSGVIGQTLMSDLEKLGISNPYFTTLVKCNPPDGRKAEPSDIRACAGYLVDEIKRQQPKFVLVLGAAAVKAICKEAKITGVVGKVIERDGISYMPCFAPAYILRDPGKEPEYRRTLKRFSELVHGRAPVLEDNLRIRIVDRFNLNDFMVDFSGESEFTCDLETSGLDWYHPDSYINCVGLYLPKAQGAWVIPIRKAPTLPTEAQRKLLHWMADRSIPVINQNWKFDSLWLQAKFDVHFYNQFDTMLAHYMLDENSPHGLKELARFHLNAPDYDLTPAEKKGNTAAEKLFKYCALDCYYTYRLKVLFSRELRKDLDTRNLFEHLLMPASRMYEEIEFEGHHVNLDRMSEVEVQLTQSQERCIAQLNRMLGRTINWNSTAQVGEALYDDLKLVPGIFTAKGAASTGVEALADLDHPIVKVLQEYRGYQKQLSTYIEGWKEFMVGDRLYLGTKLHGTVTGRYSSRLHQVPRDGTIRNLIESPQGWTFVQADLSQAELRVIAMASRDPELIRCYNEGIDIHWKTTIGVLRLGGSEEYLQMARDTVLKHRGNLDGMTMPQILDYLEGMGPDAAVAIDKGWKEKRKQSKGINFGYVYGMGATKFQEYAKVKYDWDVTKQESQSIRDAFFASYPMLTPWHERQRSLIKIDGFVKSMASRKRRLPSIWSPDKMLRAEAERQSINAPIQGFIGDLKVMGMLDIYENLQEVDGGAKLRIKGEVHDSILMWIKDEYLDEMLPRVKKSMENPYLIKQFGIELSVPIIADLEVGTWGAGKVWRGK